MSAFVHQFLDILKVSSHPHLKKLLRVAYIDLVCQLTGNPVDDNWHSAKTSVLTLAWSPASSVIAGSYLEVKQFNSFR